MYSNIKRKKSNAKNGTQKNGKGKRREHDAQRERG